MRAALATLALTVLAACGADGSKELDAGDAVEEVASACEPVIFEDTPLTHCAADPARHTIHTALADADDAIYRSLAAYAQDRGDNASSVAFAMNGGMFDEAGGPIGYFVEDGERLQRLNRNDGPGNFHLKPNGIFFGSAGKWQVMPTEQFYREVNRRPAFGTQSGPMLLINGELHPDLSADGPSRKLRNAVGVDSSGRAHFVISEAPISMGKLARFYRDVLKVENALFLDGSVSQLWDPATGRLDASAPIGPLIVVENRARAARAEG